MAAMMKIMVTSFKRSHACTATLSAPRPAAGHLQPTPLPETPGHLWASLGQPLVGSLLFSPASWCTQSSVCACQAFVSHFCVSSGGSMVGLMATSSKGGLCHTQVCCTQSPCPLWQSTADPYLQRRQCRVYTPVISGGQSPHLYEHLWFL